MRRLTPIAIAFGFVAACASAGAPPGGPERHTPPDIVSISVDSGQTNVNIKSVEFKFDEVVSDRPAGTGTALDQIFLISPRNGAPVVSWHRTRVDVRPKNGFRPNTAYRVTMLPGIVDLRGNARKDTRTLMFSTGADFPPFSIRGRVFDWGAAVPVTGAYIEATSHADTMIVYVSATDTSGQFDAGPLPAGTYTVRALIDANNNRALDRNEKWDTTTVVISTVSPAIELDAIERDSVPPSLDNFTVIDSLTLRLSFDKPLDPSLPLQPALIRVQRTDSSDLVVASVQWQSAYERGLNAERTARAAADSAKRADSLRALPKPPGAAPAAPAPPPPSGALVPGGPGQRPAPPPPKPKAPAPDRAIIVKLAPSNPILPATKYVVTAKGIRNLVGHARDSRRILDVPKPAPPPKVVTDTTKKAATDTTKKPPAPVARPPR